MKTIFFADKNKVAATPPENATVIQIEVNPKDKTVNLDNINFSKLQQAIKDLETVAAQAPKTQAEKDEEDEEVKLHSFLDSLAHNQEYDKKFPR